jgi:hypothetical protein
MFKKLRLNLNIINFEMEKHIKEKEKKHPV